MEARASAQYKAEDSRKLTVVQTYLYICYKYSEYQYSYAGFRAADGETVERGEFDGHSGSHGAQSYLYLDSQRREVESNGPRTIE